MARLLVKSKIKKVDNSTKKRVAIVGYTGAAVDLTDMGIPDPLVYNLSGFNVPNNIPYYEEHKTLIGHTIENKKIDGELLTIAEHSVENERSETVYNAIQNGDDYEASMGVEIDLAEVTFIESGTVSVNNRLFEGPIYVSNKGTVNEMTATKGGRDGNTSIHQLSQDYEDGKELLMKVKNTRLAVLNSEPDLKYLENDEYKDAPKVLIENAKKEKWDEDKFKLEVKNHVPAPPPPAPPTPTLNIPDNPPVINNSMEYLWDYVDHEVGKTLIKNARTEKWDEARMKREIEVVELKNSHPSLPDVFIPNKDAGAAGYEARLAYSIGVSPTTIEKKLGEKAAGHAVDHPIMGLREGLMYAANANGGRFNGFSDVKALAKHVRNLTVNNAFSTIDYPNLMHRVTDYLVEDKWMIDPPQAPAYCKEVSTRDFKKTGHLKPKGGKMWEILNKEGKISHGSHGKEDVYETELATVAQILTFKREDIINDDIGWVEDTLDLMIEGATMLPDYMFTNLFYDALTEGVVTSSVSHFTLALTKENLKTVYDLVRRRYTAKRAPKDDKTVNGRVNTRWNLVIPPTLEETAWDIIKQDRIVQNDVKGAAGDVGDQNYWHNRVDISVFDNLDNTTYHAGARADAWGLIPDRETYRPFYIRYLNRQARPTTERVEVPSDELGFGVRGYWDMNMGYRPVESGQLQHTGISIPST